MIRKGCVQTEKPTFLLPIWPSVSPYLVNFSGMHLPAYSAVYLPCILIQYIGMTTCIYKTSSYHIQMSCTLESVAYQSDFFVTHLCSLHELSYIKQDTYCTYMSSLALHTCLSSYLWDPYYVPIWQFMALCHGVGWRILRAVGFVHFILKWFFSSHCR